jgi:hypothetical protein
MLLKNSMLSKEIIDKEILALSLMGLELHVHNDKSHTVPWHAKILEQDRSNSERTIYSDGRMEGYYKYFAEGDSKEYVINEVIYFWRKDHGK